MLLRFTPFVLLIVVCCFFLQRITAQEYSEIQLVHSIDSIKKGISLHKEGEYEQALALYSMVHPNDSNYIDAVYEMSVTYSAMGEHQKSIDLALNAYNLSEGNAPDHYTAIGNGFDELGDPEKAMEWYNKGLERFPMYYLLHYNQAVTYGKKEDFENAILKLKRTIELYPLHASSHLNLARYALHEGELTQALMSIGYFLLIEPNSGRTNSVLVEFNDAVLGSTEIKPKGIQLSPSGDDFTQVNRLITSHAALRDDYKSDTKIKIPLTNQLDMVYKLIAKHQPGTGFWENYYTSFYTEMIDAGHFETFTYLILITSGNESHQSIVAGQLDDIREFINWAQVKLREIHGLHHRHYDPENKKVKYWFFDGSQRLEAVGNVVGDNKPDGAYVFYNQNGGISGEGAYDNGNKVGQWVHYYNNGQVYSREAFIDGKLNGERTRYFENGRLREEVTFKDGNYHGISKLYSPSGYLDRLMHHKEGKIQDSLVYFYAHGDRRMFIPFEEGHSMGMGHFYFPEGKLQNRILFKDNERHGEAETLFFDQSLSEKLVYTNGEYDGPYVSYYPNGKLESKGDYLAGSRIGVWKYYYYNGELRAHAEYDERGKENGVKKEYTQEGLLNKQFEFSQGEIKSYRHFDRDGNVIKEDKRKRGKFFYEDYTVFGVKTSEGYYTGTHTIGEWKYYTDNGLLSSEKTYNENGELIGTVKDYFDNGQVKAIKQYQRDTLQGYYQSFYENGKLEEHGHYVDGKLQGVWVAYYEDGTIRSRKYFSNGKAHGAQVSYDVAGSPISLRHFEKGELVLQERLTPDSTVYFRHSVNSVDGMEKMEYPNSYLTFQIPIVGGEYNGVAQWFFGNKRNELTGNYLNGKRHGEWVWYHPNGQIRIKGLYELGRQDGIWTYYFPDGTKERVRQYENGTIHGTDTLFHENGLISSTTIYFQGDRNNEQVFYNYEGIIDHIRYHRFGRIIGYSYLGEDGEPVPMIEIQNETAKVVNYYPNGHKSRVFQLESGSFQGTYQRFAEDGTLTYTATYLDDDLHGEQLTYYTSGELKVKKNYYHGNKHGEFVSYYPSGSVRMREHFLNNKLHGIVEHFDADGNVTTKYEYRDGDMYSEL